MESLKLCVPDDFGYWLSGLFAGDGHFAISVNEKYKTVNGKKYLAREATAYTALALRDDDACTLVYIRDTIGYGTLERRKYKKAPPHNPVVTWKVRKLEEVKFIMIPFFETYPLRAKKERDFVLWKEFVNLKWAAHIRKCLGGTRTQKLFTDDEWERAKQICGEIRDVRKYSGGNCDEFI